MQQPSDPITWRDGNIPVSTRFDDPFFSLDDGIAETRHVFLTGNDLPARFRDAFAIGELGFGTGLNLLVAWDAFATAMPGATLHFTSFEAFPLSSDDMARAHRAFPSFDGKRDALAAAWTGTGGSFDLPGLRLNVILGDARVTLPAWAGRADAWFLDGFAPAKNPELWSPELMAEVAAHTAPQGTAATYTAAGDVRRGLAAAGFEVQRVQGFGRKRHMTRARIAG
ncbi:tRNA (5-methylaminomethyl-2-thiouridine)(34)-methyltransferase MnmD [Sulfitobacter sp. PR48]|uniref:tRNA (5-methylaminomethyl-2-thiouridine)(34)-methyltransferase MnmD n=1 Tax=Sulfitobacter sp. PR48 TaxID=3028383 RepID=UPI00237B88A4|nr:tRNA (5-methylaminomethyl-2-thiouridine)(34)-methyltransferase MnmD [Sulfitobacter sp. PR48]MDD9719929.1 tRNA (5-methylaminomethyl-2-thiouridine)(34)-methyltransferase MnmD [Sulfitobacter sp. PR48]